MTRCPWNTIHILCFEQSRWIKSGIKYLCPLYFNHAIYSIYKWTDSSFYLKGISCGNNFPVLSYHHDKNVLQLSPTEPPPFVNLYHGSLFPAHHAWSLFPWTLRTCYVSRVTIYGVPSVSFSNGCSLMYFYYTWYSLNRQHIFWQFINFIVIVVAFYHQIVFYVCNCMIIVYNCCLITVFSSPPK